MKREKTSVDNVVRYPNGDLYYRKGDLELKLDTKDLEDAKELRDVISARATLFGAKALKFKVKAVAPLFLKEVKNPGPKDKKYSAASKYKIEQTLRDHIIPYFGKLRLAEVNERAWFIYTKKGKVNDYLAHRNVLNLLLRWCRNHGYYEGYPKFTLPEHTRRQRRVLGPEQIKALFTHAHKKFLLFCALTLLHHLRRGEAISIHLDLLNLTEKWVALDPEFVKTRKGRFVPLNDFTVQLIKLHLKALEDKGIKSRWLFPNARDPKRHMTVGGFRASWSKVQERAEGKLDGFTWHDFRATGETHAHKSKDHTDTQREKFSGASVDIQKRIYVDMTADDVRGLENAVQVEGLNDIFVTQLHAASLATTGKARG